MNGPQAPILDAAVLDELLASVQHDRGFVVQLVEAYLGDGERQLEQIAAAGAIGDAEALIRPAHTLKSSSATVGAERLAELARSVEHAAREGHTDDAQASAGALPAAWSDASAALRAWIDGGSA